MVVMPADLEVIGGNEFMLLAREAHNEHAVAHEAGVGGAGVLTGNLADALARSVDGIGNERDALILRIDHDKVVLIHVGEELRLGARVILVAAMPCEMVGGDVEEHADARMQLGRRGKLIA